MCVNGHVIYLSEFIRCRCQKLLDVLFRFFLSFNWTLGISLLLPEALIESFLLVRGDYSFCFTQKIQCRKFIRNPASSDIISDSMEHWDVKVCFFLIQFTGTNDRLSNNIKIPWSWFRVFQISSKVWVLEQSQSTILCLITLLTKLSGVFCNMNMWRNLINRLSHTWVHLKLHESVYWQTIKYQDVQFMSGTSTSWQIVSIPLIQVPLSWIDDHPSRNLKLCAIAQLSYLSIHYIFPRISEHVLPYRKTMQLFLREVFSQLSNFSVVPAEIRDSNIFVYSSKLVFN